MGRLIDIDKARKEYSNLTDLTMSDTTLLLTLFSVLDNAPTVEAYTKDQVVAMITELQLDISELKSYESADGQDLVMLADIGTLFQQKINNLKED